MHITFQIFQAMNGILRKLMVAIDFQCTGGKIVRQEMTEILRDDSTGCNKVGNNDDYHKNRQRQTFNMSVTWMRNSFDHLQ